MKSNTKGAPYKPLYNRASFNTFKEMLVARLAEYEANKTEKTGYEVNKAMAFLLHCLDIDRIKALQNQAVKHHLEMTSDDIQLDPEENNQGEPINQDLARLDKCEMTQEGDIVKKPDAKTFVEREIELDEEEIEMGRAVRIGMH
jgi:hypothetical protein